MNGYLADYYFEADNAKYVAVYGSKPEGTFAIALFKNSDCIRCFGHGGIGSPAPGNPCGIEWFFRFENVPNFVFGGYSPQIAGKGGDGSATSRPTTIGTAVRTARTTRSLTCRTARMHPA